MKPLYARASKLAVAPFLNQAPTSEEEEKKRKRFKNAPIIDTALPPIPDVPKPQECRAVGVITGEYKLDLAQAFGVVEVRCVCVCVCARVCVCDCVCVHPTVHGCSA